MRCQALVWILGILILTRAPAVSGPSAENCRVCHLEIYREWRESWHSKSTANRNYAIAVQRWVAEGHASQDCMACHAPAPVFSSAPKPRVEYIPPKPTKDEARASVRKRAWQEKEEEGLAGLETAPSFSQRERHRVIEERQEIDEALMRLPEPRSDNLGEGVTCVSCHEARGSVMVGPYDCAAPHPTAKHPSMKTVRACVSCHGQLDRPCQKQVQSWELSPVKTKHVCHSCHMPVSDGKLVQWINFEGLPTRKVASHRFPAAHDPITLQSAIRLEVEVVEGMVVIGLANRGSGHQVPASPWRKLIALVQVFDAQGREVLRKRDGFFQERGNAIKPLGREIITFTRRGNHAKVKVTLFYRFYANQPDTEAQRVVTQTFAL